MSEIDPNRSTPSAGAAPGPPRRWPGALGWLGRAALWLPATLVGAVLAGALVIGGWAGSEGSLAQALRWGLAWQQENAPEMGTVNAQGVQGSVLGGGDLASLSWTSQGLEVRAEGVRLRLGGAFWLGLLQRHLRLAELHADRLEVVDRREPSSDGSSGPFSALELPLPIDAHLSIDRLALDGATPLDIGNLRARYRYGRAEAGLGVTDAHTLELDSLQWAEGRYRGQATLGAQAPMPLRLQARGELRTTVPEGAVIELRARASAEGHLGGNDAQLDLAAQIEPTTSADAAPTLAATARLRPWDAQPVAQADVRANRLNVALLWPGAPTTSLSGTAQARPEGQRWVATVRLDNEGSGPLDRQRLPIQSLSAEVAQEGTLWTVSDLQAVLAGGRVQASGRIELPLAGAAGAPTAPAPPASPPPSPLGAWQGTLGATGINPSLVWSTLAPAALDAQFKARSVGTTARPAIDIDARVRPAGRQPSRSAADALRLRELVLQGVWQPAGGGATRGSLDLRTARLDALDGQLDAEGVIDTTAPRAQGRLALAVPGLQARWQGALAHGTGDGDLDLDVQSSERWLAWLRGLRALPMVGEPLAALLDPWADLQLEGAAQARVRWQGGLCAFGFPGAGARPPPPRLDLALDVARLRVQRAGEANADEPIATLDLLLEQTRLRASGPLSSLDLNLQGRATQGSRRLNIDTEGQLALDTPALNVRRGALRLSRLNLQATLGLNTARTSQWALSATRALQARWQPGQQGRSDTLDAELEPGSLSLQPLVRNGSAATPLSIAWDGLAWRAGALQSTGRLEGLPLAWIDALATAQADPTATPESAVQNAARPIGPIARAGLGGDLVFDGRWDIRLPSDAAAPPRLNITLQRRSGDLAVQTDGAFDDNATRNQRVVAGVKAAQLDVSTDGTRVLAQLRWDSERFGRASAELRTALSPPDADHTAWHWREDAAVGGQIDAALPEVGVWSALAPPGWRVRGSLTADATLSGTRAKPLFAGRLQADNLALRSIVNGIVFRNGRLRATLAGERIEIESFRLEGRGGAERGGVLQASGSAEWRTVTRDGATVREPLIELQASADKLRASTRADRRLTVTGNLGARLEGPALRLRGSLRADEALIVLPDELAPSLSGDVVVRGTEYPITPESAVRVQPDVQITLDLGPAFELRGQGLQTRLAGQLEVRSLPTAPAPRVVGEVRTASGSYRAYGQQLAIESGVLRFSGPYDNPALDITAVRPNTSVRVGVQITGTAQLPRVRLFSDPDLPDSEKLAWLVLGRPASGAGAEAAVLQQAALALLAGRDGGALDGGLASALGLDTLSFTGSGTNADGSESSAALMLGKRLSQDLYLSYERGLAGTLNTVSIFYDVSRRFTIRARAGSENAIDLIFTLTYD